MPVRDATVHGDTPVSIVIGTLRNATWNLHRGDKHVVHRPSDT
jgi:hypothetical protein